MTFNNAGLGCDICIGTIVQLDVHHSSLYRRTVIIYVYIYSKFKNVRLVKLPSDIITDTLILNVEMINLDNRHTYRREVI